MQAFCKGEVVEMLRFDAAMFAATICIASNALAIQFQNGMNADLLGGSFHSTCSQCKVYPNGLFCKCLSKDQSQHFTRLNLTYCANASSISNDNGQLTCDPVIRGSWGLSCVKAWVIQDTILAHCKDTNGEIRSTGVFMVECPSLKLENFDGNLRCMK
jgi:hypothetical protein